MSGPTDWILRYIKTYLYLFNVWREAKDETNGILDRNDLVDTATEGRKGTIPPNKKLNMHVQGKRKRGRPKKRQIKQHQGDTEDYQMNE